MSSGDFNKAKTILQSFAKLKEYSDKKKKEKEVDKEYQQLLDFLERTHNYKSNNERR